MPYPLWGDEEWGTLIHEEMQCADAVNVMVSVAVVLITAETVVVAVRYNVFVTTRVALYSSTDGDRLWFVKHSVVQLNSGQTL